MENSKRSYWIIMFMLAVYLISAAQFLIAETNSLVRLAGKSYADKLDYLDTIYYKRSFYEHYLWLNGLLPVSVTFSILYNDNTDRAVGYPRWVHKFDYYFYPRYVLLEGAVNDIARTRSHFPFVSNLRYSDVVFVLSIRYADLRQEGRLKYIFLNGRKFYLVAANGDKGLLLERSLIKKAALKGDDWANVRREFRKLYGIDMNKAVF